MVENEQRRRVLGIITKGGGVLAGLAVLGKTADYVARNKEVIRKKLPGLDWVLGEKKSPPSNVVKENKENSEYQSALLEVFRRTLADIDLTLMTNGQFWNLSSEEQERLRQDWNIVTEKAVANVLAGKAEWWSDNLWK